MESVALSAEDTLRERGLKAEVSENGEEVHIASRTPGGVSFTFVLTQVPGKAGEQTRIRLKLDKEGDARSVPEVALLMAEMTSSRNNTAEPDGRKTTTPPTPPLSKGGRGGVRAQE